MRNKVILLSIVLFVVFGVIALFIYTSKQNTPEIKTEENVTTTLPGNVIEVPEQITEESTPPEEQNTPQFVKPTGSTMQVASNKTGEMVSINNVYNVSTGDLSLNGAELKDNEQYFLAYYPNEQAFLITIKSKNLETARQSAEKELLLVAGVNKTDACKLNVYMYVPLAISEANAGRNFGLSFCPGSRKFEK